MECWTREHVGQGTFLANRRSHSTAHFYLLSEHQKFEILSKCLEKISKISKFLEVADHDCHLEILILCRCCGEIKVWAVEWSGRLASGCYYSQTSDQSPVCSSRCF